MICPPARYQDVACTPGTKRARNASVSANCCAAVLTGTPVWPSSVRFGVYHTKSGGFAASRAPVKVEASETVILVCGKYSHGLCLTAYRPESSVGSVGRFSAYAFSLKPAAANWSANVDTLGKLPAEGG